MNADHANGLQSVPHLLGRRRVLLGGGAAAAMSVLAACSSSGGSTASGGKKLRIFHVPKFTTLPYFQSAQAGAAEAAKELGDSIVYTGPSTSNAEQQVASLQTVVSQRPDVILLSAIEPDNVAPVLQRARAQGTVVVTYDADCQADARDLFCNQLSYRLAATTYLDAALMDHPEGGLVDFMAATPTTVNHMQQIANMKIAMATIDKYKVFTPGQTYFVNDDTTQSYNQMVSIMQNPQVKFVISGSAVSAPVAAQAIDSTGHAGKVWATGAALPSLITKVLRDGSEKAFVLWDVKKLGYMACYAGHLIKTGKLKVAEGAKFTAGSVGTFTIGADNVADYNRPIIFTKQNVSQYAYLG